MNKISVVINTLNEAENLPRAISSVKELADEIVVVDMKSDDGTQEIAKKVGAKLYEHERTNYVEPARNFAISKATHDWILILDADEEIPASLHRKLKVAVENSQVDYYALPRKNLIFGKWIKHSRWWPDYNIRFFRKGAVLWNEVIHSVPMTKGNGMDFSPEEENAIIHFHYTSIDQYLTRLIRYTGEHAKLLKKDGVKFSWRDLISKPANEFLSRYFQGEGYKDGIHGFALASLQAVSELVLYLKLWEMEKFEDKDIRIKDVVREMRKVENDFHYWQADVQVKNGAGLSQRIKRKFRLP